MERPLRILFASPAYWPAHAFGGPVVVARELVSRLVARGHRVDVLTTSLRDVGERPSASTTTENVDGAKQFLVDLVDVFRRPKDIPAHLDDLLAARPHAVSFQSGIRNDEAAEVLARAGIDVVQDRCLMIELEARRQHG